MEAHAEKAEAGPVGNEGAAGPSWSESPLRPLPPRRGQPRALEDGGADRTVAPAACLVGRERSKRPAQTGGGVQRIATSRRLDRRRDPEGGSEDRPEGAGPAVAGQVRGRPVGPGPAGLAPEARGGRAPRPAGVGCRWTFPDMATSCPDLETSGVSKCRHDLSRSRQMCPDLERAGRSSNCWADENLRILNDVRNGEQFRIGRRSLWFTTVARSRSGRAHRARAGTPRARRGRSIALSRAIGYHPTATYT